MGLDFPNIRDTSNRISALVTVAVATGLAGWSLLGDFQRDRTDVPAREADAVCPRDALPLGADAERRSRALALADAHLWIRARSPLEVAGAAPRGCGAQLGRPAVVVRLSAPAERTTWELVVYLSPEGYRIWSAASCDGPSEWRPCVSG
jgi:hypothetical protein